MTYDHVVKIVCPLVMLIATCAVACGGAGSSQPGPARADTNPRFYDVPRAPEPAAGDLHGGTDMAGKGRGGDHKGKP